MQGRKNSSASLKEKMAWFSEECRRAGLKLTHQRLEIYRELASAGDHPSVETVYQRIRNRIPTISLDTVYRTLAHFEELGFVSKVHTIQNQAHYDAVREQHHHLICERCGNIMDFKWEALDNTPVPDTVTAWGKIHGTRVTLQGVCADCGQAKR
jgi:Fur family transcriptional regulator, peroxide stress response regulator